MFVYLIGSNSDHEKMALNLDEDLFSGLNVVPVSRFYSLNTFIINIIYNFIITSSIYKNH